MARRPLFQKGVKELERLFAENRDDFANLTQLSEELRHRKTKRAQALHKRVEQALRSNKPPALPQTSGLSDGQQLPLEIPQSIEPEIPDKTNEPTASLSPTLAPSELPIVPFAPPPPITNEPTNILTAWTAMEVLSPSSFRSPEDLAGGDRKRIAHINREIMPWDGAGEKSRPNYRLYYQVVLGSIEMEPAVSALLKVYTDSRYERPQARGESVLATVMVDKEGRPVENDAVSVSSFGWGVPKALSGNLEGLGHWRDAEGSLIAALTERLVKEDEEGQPIPLNIDSILGAYEWLINKLGLDQSLTSPPAFVIRTYQYFRVQEPPEPLILNSFFLDDLGKAISLLDNGTAPTNLQRYLGMIAPDTRQNLMSDNQAIEMALQPSMFPAGSWPSNGRHPLVLLQQCAVNLALNDLKENGILAVNGPPGTGKTTLLRDVIAAIVTERAKELCLFDDPEQAFKHSGQKLKKGNAFLHLYKLDDRIRGHEIIVASSNNKAVENVSAELPGINEVASDAGPVRYFKTVSDNLLKRESWGTIAAVLGNAANRANFRRDFWWDDDFGLQTYFQHAVGNPKPKLDDAVNPPVERLPVITERENPPHDHTDALRRWQAARRDYLDALSETEGALDVLQNVFQLLQSIRRRTGAVASLELKIAELDQRVFALEKDTKAAQAVRESRSRLMRDAQTERDASLQRKPGLFQRLFNWNGYRDWKRVHAEIDGRSKRTEDGYTQAHKAVEQIEAKKHKLERAKENLRHQLAVERRILEEENDRYTDMREEISGVLIDDDFFERDHKGRQCVAPWLDKETARLRNDLFEHALTAQKAFIDAAAKPIRHNLNVLIDDFGTNSLGTPEKDALIPDLWATLFLIVPVVSTTFASVSRMFGRIGAESLGWLLIDEAGQALPQAAVGALIRTKRAVVVGDPIQIEPVVVLPDSLTEAISKRFGVDPLIYNAPSASTQTLADTATAYFGTFETQFGTREVGVPLLVHRRCSEPMFSISNRVAYENLMVQAKPERPSRIRDVLGPSRWIDVTGTAQEKWCPEEGYTVIDLLSTLRNANCQPDLYVITPFVIVQNKLRDKIRASGLLTGWVDKPDSWVYEHVGTVHTVQGREAEAIIFVLGAQKQEQRGARGWAGGRPNLLNVATTRAKEAVYVVGNANLWQNAGVFRFLHAHLDNSRG